MDALVSAVGHIDQAVGADGDPVRFVEFARALAVMADALKEFPIRGIEMNLIVDRVGDPKTSGGVHRHSGERAGFKGWRRGDDFFQLDAVKRERRSGEQRQEKKNASSKDTLVFSPFFGQLQRVK